MKLKIIFGMIILGGVILLNTTGIKQMRSNQTLALVITQASAGEEGCTTTPNQNSGVCKQKIGGGGYSCVEAGFWDTKDCSGD